MHQVACTQTPAPDPFEGRRAVPDCKSTSMSEFCLLIIVMTQPFVSLPRKKAAAAYALALAVAQVLISQEALQSHSA